MSAAQLQIPDQKSSVWCQMWPLLEVLATCVRICAPMPKSPVICPRSPVVGKSTTARGRSSLILMASKCAPAGQTRSTFPTNCPRSKCPQETRNSICERLNRLRPINVVIKICSIFYTCVARSAKKKTVWPSGFGADLNTRFRSHLAMSHFFIYRTLQALSVTLAGVSFYRTAGISRAFVKQWPIHDRTWCIDSQLE